MLASSYDAALMGSSEFACSVTLLAACMLELLKGICMTVNGKLKACCLLD
jgi:hypothetical protein